MYIVNPFYASRLGVKRGRTPVTRSYTVLALFSGIGGFSLGLEKAGMNTVAFCEIDGFCLQVLRHHWPRTPIYNDIRQLSARRLHHDAIPSIDLICGGYPCQPFSIAGNQRGTEDPRHLWPQMYRLVRELRPRWVVCENVAGHVELGLDAVLDDLEHAGYTATPFIIQLVPSRRRIGGTAYGLLPTPLASDARGQWGRKDDNLLRNYLPRRFGGIYPHPSLLETMMGFPSGWTEPTPSETPSSRRSRN